MTRTQKILTATGIMIALAFSMSALYNSTLRESPHPAPQHRAKAQTYTPPPGYVVQPSRANHTIEALIAAGGRRWIQFNLDRIYFDEDALGCQLPAGTKAFYDVKRGRFVAPQTPGVTQAITRLQATLTQ